MQQQQQERSVIEELRLRLQVEPKQQQHHGNNAKSKRLAKAARASTVDLRMKLDALVTELQLADREYLDHSTSSSGSSNEESDFESSGTSLAATKSLAVTAEAQAVRFWERPKREEATAFDSDGEIEKRLIGRRASHVMAKSTSSSRLSQSDLRLARGEVGSSSGWAREDDLVEMFAEYIGCVREGTDTWKERFNIQGSQVDRTVTTSAAVTALGPRGHTNTNTNHTTAGLPLLLPSPPSAPPSSHGSSLRPTPQLPNLSSAATPLATSVAPVVATTAATSTSSSRQPYETMMPTTTSSITDVSKKTKKSPRATAATVKPSQQHKLLLELMTPRTTRRAVVLNEPSPTSLGGGSGGVVAPSCPHCRMHREPNSAWNRRVLAQLAEALNAAAHSPRNRTKTLTNNEKLPNILAGSLKRQEQPLEEELETLLNEDREALPSSWYIGPISKGELEQLLYSHEDDVISADIPRQLLRDIDKKMWLEVGRLAMEHGDQTAGKEEDEGQSAMRAMRNAATLKKVFDELLEGPCASHIHSAVLAAARDVQKEERLLAQTVREEGIATSKRRAAELELAEAEEVLQLVASKTTAMTSVAGLFTELAAEEKALEDILVKQCEAEFQRRHTKKQVAKVTWSVQELNRTREDLLQIRGDLIALARSAVSAAEMKQLEAALDADAEDDDLSLPLDRDRSDVPAHGAAPSSQTAQLYALLAREHTSPLENFLSRLLDGGVEEGDDPTHAARRVAATDAWDLVRKSEEHLGARAPIQLMERSTSLYMGQEHAEKANWLLNDSNAVVSRLFGQAVCTNCGHYQASSMYCPQTGEIHLATATERGTTPPSFPLLQSKATDEHIIVNAAGAGGSFSSESGGGEEPRSRRRLMSVFSGRSRSHHTTDKEAKLLQRKQSTMLLARQGDANWETMVHDGTSSSDSEVEYANCDPDSDDEVEGAGGQAAGGSRRAQRRLANQQQSKRNRLRRLAQKAVGVEKLNAANDAAATPEVQFVGAEAAVANVVQLFSGELRSRLMMSSSTRLLAEGAGGASAAALGLTTATTGLSVGEQPASHHHHPLVRRFLKACRRGEGDVAPHPLFRQEELTVVHNMAEGFDHISDALRQRQRVLETPITDPLNLASTTKHLSHNNPANQAKQDQQLEVRTRGKIEQLNAALLASQVPMRTLLSRYAELDRNHEDLLAQLKRLKTTSVEP